MSGHSKWAKIHRNKEVTDAKRAARFTKLANAITVAVREGGPNPDANLKLRLAIENARAQNLPKENIIRAIQRGTGEISGSKIEEIFYEGFGPGGCAFLIQCFTDNRNRTSAEMKHLFSQYGGKMGSPNSVLWQFEKRGVVEIDILDEHLELELIECGALDIKEGDNKYRIFCPPENLQKIQSVIEKRGIPIQRTEITFIPKEKNTITSPEDLENLKKYIASLKEHNDVGNFYTTADISF